MSAAERAQAALRDIERRLAANAAAAANAAMADDAVGGLNLGLGADAMCAYPPEPPPPPPMPLRPPPPPPSGPSAAAMADNSFINVQSATFAESATTTSAATSRTASATSCTLDGFRCSASDLCSAAAAAAAFHKWHRCPTPAIRRSDRLCSGIRSCGRAGHGCCHQCRGADDRRASHASRAAAVPVPRPGARA